MYSKKDRKDGSRDGDSYVNRNTHHMPSVGVIL